MISHVPVIGRVDLTYASYGDNRRKAIIALISEWNATMDSNSGNEDALGKLHCSRARTVLETVDNPGDRRQRMEASEAASDNENATAAAAALVDVDEASEAPQRVARDLITAAHAQVLSSGSTISNRNCHPVVSCVRLGSGKAWLRYIVAIPITSPS